MRLAKKGARLLRKGARILTGCCCPSGISTPCCPGVDVPTTLHGLFTTTCLCWPNSYASTLTYDAGRQQWLDPTNAFPNACAACSASVAPNFFWEIAVECVPDPVFGIHDWFVAIGENPLEVGCPVPGVRVKSCLVAPAGIQETPPFNPQCDPFQVTFQGVFADFSGTAPCDCKGTAWSFVVTE